jgi:hypothetical protein
MKVRFLLLLALLLASAASVSLMQEPALEEQVAWVCPMHPEYTMDVAGKCPRCGMALVEATPFDVRDYRLDFRTIPPVVRAGQPATLQFEVFHPGTGAPIEQFEMVHQQRYHLFVVGQDMEHFEHIHPVQQSDGSWSIEVTLPRPGYYKVLSDFLPGGGTSQFLARPLVTAGYEGDLMGDSARLVPDSVLTKTVGDVTATLALDPPTFVAGLYGHLNFFLTDTATGQPISDLQTYLGAFGHTLVMSEDMASYVHSHPINVLDVPEDGGLPVFLIPPGADLESLRGGPEVSFDGLIPKAGRYRAWTQFRRNDKLYTFAFTFEAVAGQE